MTNPNTLAALLERIKRKAPEYFDILTAETNEEFDRAFDVVLGQAISSLERQSNNYKRLDEVGLSGVLATALSIPGLTVTPEAHSNGHVDLLIMADHSVPQFIKLAEAKIHRGYGWHAKGLSQLIGRYTTGRETRGLLISFVKQMNISGATKEVREKMDEHSPCFQQGKTSDHIFKWSFLSKHAHPCGDTLEVGHVGCNLFVKSK
jgi:DNA modification methylase